MSRAAITRRRCCLALFVSAALGIALAGSAGARTDGAPSPSGPPSIVSEQLLPTGAVKRVFSNGAVFVGNPEAEVTFGEDETGAPVGFVADPGPASPQEAASRAASYREHGRTVRQDAIDAGIPAAELPDVDDSGPAPRSLAGRKRANYNYGTPNSVYDSGCLTLNKTSAYWHGCFTRKGTSSSDCCAFYLADESQAAGHAKYGGYWLRSGYTQHRYSSGDSIVKWQPGSDISSSSCSTFTIGLSGFGASLSESFNFCPVEVHVSITTTTFRSTWKGCKGAQYTPGTAAETFTRVPRGYSPTLYYGIGYTYQTSKC